MVTQWMRLFQSSEAKDSHNLGDRQTPTLWATKKKNGSLTLPKFNIAPEKLPSQ